ncbi:MAG TPA: DNA repair protein RecO, partial [Tepidisphaeraceae bacterium]|nr:DNA repair protein RecO [Tepidisphaeraceae bacterium]
AQYAAELVSLLIEEHDPHPDLFDHLQNCLQSLSTTTLEQSFLAFQIELLRETGYLPELSTCTSCGREIATSGANQISFSPDRGGVLCRNCEPSFPQRFTLNSRLLGIMQLFTTNGTARLPILTRHQTDPINKLLAEYIEHTLGRRLRLPKYILGRTQTG